MNKLFFKIKKFLQGKYHWFFKSIFKWNWLDFYDIREYKLWDDIRYLNWKLLGRYQKFFVNLFINEKQADFHVFIDINYNFKWWIEKLNFEKVKEFLSDYYIFARKNNISSLFFYNKKIRKIKTIEDFFYTIKDMENILNMMPDKYISFFNWFINLQKKIRKKRVILVISDFLTYSWELNVFKNYDVFLVKVPIANIWQNYIFYKESNQFYIL